QPLAASRLRTGLLECRLAQWGGTHVHGPGTLIVSSLSGARGAWPCRRSARPGNHQPRRNCRWTSPKGLTDPGGDWWHLGASVIWLTDPPTVPPQPYPPQPHPVKHKKQMTRKAN